MCYYLDYKGILELSGLFFGEIGKSEQDTKWWSTRTVELEDSLLTALKNLAIREIERSSSNKAYGAVFRADMHPRENIRRELSRLRMIRLPDDYDVFEDTSVAITLKMAEEIDARSGICSLIIAILKHGDNNIVVLLTIDCELTRQFDLNILTKSLNRQPSRVMLLNEKHFQKGAIYPHPFISSLDIKVIEKNPSEYFKNYLCVSRVYELSEFLDFLEKASKSTRGHNLSISEIVRLFQLLRTVSTKKDKILSGKNLEKAMTKFVLGNEGEKIKDFLVEKGVTRILVNRSMLKSIDIRLDLDMGKLEGKADDLLTSMIHRKYPGGQVISIASDELETDLEAS
jgi:hypothetical protein